MSEHDILDYEVKMYILSLDKKANWYSLEMRKLAFIQAKFKIIDETFKKFQELIPMDF